MTTTTSPFSSAAIDQLRLELSAAFSAELAAKSSENAALAAKISRLEDDVTLLRAHHAELNSRLSKLESPRPDSQGRVEITEEDAIVDESDGAKKGEPRPFDLNEKAAPFRGGGVVVEISDGDDDVDEEDEQEGKETVRPVPTPSRKRFLRVVASDSEDDDDDDSKPISFMFKKARAQIVTDEVEDEEEKPISFMFKKARAQIVTDEVEDQEEKNNVANEVEDPEASSPPRRRSTRLQKSGEKSSLHKVSGTKSQPKRKKAACRKLDYSDTEEEDGGEEESESEGESLGGFIVEDDDCDGPAQEDGESSDSEEGEEKVKQEEEEESDVDYDGVMMAIRREKKSDKWEYEADMLSAFSSCPELCLLAVCALYRQQTSEEQSVKATFVQNKRGFNQLDATRYA